MRLPSQSTVAVVVCVAALALLLLALCCGCTSTTFSHAGTSVKRSTFLTKTAIGEVAIHPDGSATLKSYNQQGDVEMAVAVTDAAVKAAISSAKP